MTEAEKGRCVSHTSQHLCMFSRISKREYSRVSCMWSSVCLLWFGLVCAKDNGSFASVISTH